MKEILLNVINTYQNTAFQTLTLLEAFSPNMHPLRARFTGEIADKGYIDERETIYYKFHGAGCEVAYKETGEIIDFDFNQFNDDKFSFSSLRIVTFLSYGKYHQKLKQLSALEIDKLMQDLWKLGKLEKITEHHYIIPQPVQAKSNQNQITGAS